MDDMDCMDLMDTAASSIKSILSISSIKRFGTAGMPCATLLDEQDCALRPDAEDARDGVVGEAVAVEGYTVGDDLP